MKITILTEPVTILMKTKEMAKYILGRHRKYGGHYAVTRSLVEGLEKIGFQEFNYRPSNEKEIYENVHVLSGVSTLLYAIELKKKGKIKHLSAGPNIVVFSTDYDKLICSKEIDLYMQPCRWATEMHIQHAPELEGRCVSWPAGVDSSKYQVLKNGLRDKVLIYYKSGDRQLMWQADYILRNHGYKTIIIEYGRYQFNDFLSILSSSIFMVVIGSAESQGLFLAEAWMMDVPTLCYETGYYRWEGMKERNELIGENLSCPYLTSKTGMIYRDIRELTAIIQSWDERKKEMEPRKWVFENMSDEVCANNFLEILRDKYEYKS